MDPAFRRGRAVGGHLRELLIWLTQETKRPIDHRLIAQLRLFGERCYDDGQQEAIRSSATTAPPPRGTEP